MYRPQEKRGLQSCNYSTSLNSHFCHNHSTLINIKMQLNVNIFMGPNIIVDHTNLYECLARFWDSKRSNNRDFLNACAAVDIICYLFDFSYIGQLANRLHINVRPTKMTAAFDLIYIFWEVYHFPVNRAIVIQRAWLSYQKNKDTFINRSCPFTLTDTKMIERSNLFTFWEDNKLFAFTLNALYSYIINYKNVVNPLTRQPFDHKMIEQVVVQYNSRHIKTREQGQGQGGVGQGQELGQVGQGVGGVGEEACSFVALFTEIASLFEMPHSIWINPQWLINISPTDLLFVIKACRYTFQSHYFDTIIDIMDLTLVSDDLVISTFLEHAKVLLVKEAAPSRIVYRFANILAQVSRPIDESLPDWVT